MCKALLIIGTRPELIKVAPLIQEMEARGLREELLVVNTGQHRELMTNTFRFLGISPDYTLDIMMPGQSLNELTGRALMQLQDLLQRIVKEHGKISLLLSQGDTATSLCASMTAFHNRIPFAHIEGGLRTYDYDNPFPEEYYRRIISLNAFVHFTPTGASGLNLLKEGVDPARILVTGNTIVDSVNHIKRLKLHKKDSHLPERIRSDIRARRKIVLITCHRRENSGANVRNIIQTVKELAQVYTDHQFVWIRHPNPSIKKAVERSGLTDGKNIYLIDPLDYFDMIQLFPHVKILLTDSGGLQEEAPSFKVPVLVLRETTERIESIQNGYAFLCGANKRKIEEGFRRCVAGHVRIGDNPYGDGKASKRIADFIQDFLAVNHPVHVKPAQIYASRQAGL